MHEKLGQYFKKKPLSMGIRLNIFSPVLLHRKLNEIKYFYGKEMFAKTTIRE
jgi:hypothetical protein